MDFLRDLRSIRLPPQPYLDRGHAIPYLPIDRSKVFSIIFYLCQEVKKREKTLRGNRIFPADCGRKTQTRRRNKTIQSQPAPLILNGARAFEAPVKNG